MSRKPIIKVCVIYVGSILFAAVVYYLMFLVNTTSFYIIVGYSGRHMNDWQNISIEQRVANNRVIRAHNLCMNLSLQS